MSRLATIPAAELERILDGSGRWRFRVEVRRPGGAWVNLSAIAGGDWVLKIRTERDSPDQPVGSFSVVLLKRANGASTAPGISASALNRDAQNTFAPLAFAGNHIRIAAANLAPTETEATATWRPWLSGRISSTAWPGRDVVASCHTWDRLIQRVQIKEKKQLGEDGSQVPAGERIQALLTRWLGGAAPMIVDEADPDLKFGPSLPSVGSLGERAREYAQSIAHDLRYRWHEPSQDFRYTLYQPPRDKVVPDLALNASEILDVPGLEVSDEHVRNDFEIEYPDSATGERQTLTDSDPASIEQYGPVSMRIVEEDGSPIDTAPKAAALLGYAKHDIAQPPTEARKRIPFLPWLSLHDLLDIAPDGEHFDFGGLWAVVGSSHEVDSDQGAYTDVDLRAGSPVGMYYGWRARTAPPEERVPELYDVREISSTATHRTYGYRLGGTATELWLAYRVWRDDAVPADPWAVVREEVMPVSGPTFDLPIPGEGYRLFAQLEPRDDAGRAGRVRRIEIGGTAAFVDVQVTYSENPSRETGTWTIRKIDPRGVIGSVRAWLTVDGVRTGPHFPTSPAAGVYEYSIALDLKHVPLVEFELQRLDGHEAIWRGPYTPDIAGIAQIEDVRVSYTGGVATVLVDADRDSAGLRYAEMIGGVQMDTFEMPLRGGNPQYGRLEVAVTPGEPRLFRLWAVNDSLTPGPYREVGIDAGAALEAPRILLASVLEQGVDRVIQYLGNDRVLSWRFQRINPPSGGEWEFTRGGQGGTVVVPVPSAETWFIEVRAYSEPEGHVTGSTPYDSAFFAVSGDTATPATVQLFEVVAPDLGQSEVTITLNASSSSGSAHIFARERIGFGVWEEAGEITGLLTPSLSSPPTSVTEYSYTSGYVHTSDPSNRVLVRMQFRAELRTSGGDVTDATEWIERSWYAEAQ